MTKKWTDIRRKHAPEVEERIRAKVKAKAQGMTLHQLREARELTRVNLAQVLKINQGAVSTMEKRTDMYVWSASQLHQSDGGRAEDCGRVSRGFNSDRAV